MTLKQKRELTRFIKILRKTGKAKTHEQTVEACSDFLTEHSVPRANWGKTIERAEAFIR